MNHKCLISAQMPSFTKRILRLINLNIYSLLQSMLNQTTSIFQKQAVIKRELQKYSCKQSRQSRSINVSRTTSFQRNPESSILSTSSYKIRCEQRYLNNFFHEKIKINNIKNSLKRLKMPKISSATNFTDCLSKKSTDFKLKKKSSQNIEINSFLKEERNQQFPPNLISLHESKKATNKSQIIEVLLLKNKEYKLKLEKQRLHIAELEQILHEM